jgi:hypothetical protein
MMQANAAETEIYGWHFLAKDIADYANETLLNAYKIPAMEFFSIVSVMQSKIRMNQNTQVNAN